MLKNVSLSLALGLFCLPALAQSAVRTDTPHRGDIAAGYSYVNFYADGSSESFNGASLSGAYNFTNWIAVAGDFDFVRSTLQGPPSTDIRTYTLGPRIFHRAGRFTPFAECMVGGGTLTLASFSSTDFALNMLGGVDINLDKRGRFAVRPEAAYLRIGSNPVTNGVHAGADLAYHF
jgi:hypothetical protein